MTATRPITIKEYKTIMELLSNGFEYIEDNKTKIFRPNKKVKLALILEANVGLRVGDIIRLTPNSIKGNKLSIIEKKTNKLQWRTINPNIALLIKDYAYENNINPNQKLIDISEKAIQKSLRIICKYLQLENVSTHSFRKMFATEQYKNSNNDLYAVKELLNHSDISTTQRYVKLNQEEIDRLSESFCILF